MASADIIIVGGGLAGLMATIKAAEAGAHVHLFSLVPVKRSHSVCAQGGINGAVNTKGEGDSPWEHFDDTVYGGDFLANQPPVKAMCEAAPGIIHLMDRMGVMFNRTPEGLLDFRRFGGTKRHRTAFAGATTGQQLLYALDEQVRRWEAEGLVTKSENWEFLSVILDDAGVCRGISAQNLKTMEIQTFPSDAVILASGGPGIIFGKTTNSVINTGTAASAVYQQGVHYANGEFIQIHPTAIPGDDKLRLMSESARGEGGRIWTYKDGKPWYFLEEKYPSYGNLVPRDIATREIFNVCVDQGLGINGENMVYLDLSHKDPKELDVKLGGIIEIYEKFMGDDPRKIPMKIFPAVHYSMGGMWVDYNQMTNIPGLFAAGECEYQYHGANRLGANSLVSAIYGGMVSGPKAVEYIKGLKKSVQDIPSSVFDSFHKQQVGKYESLLSMSGTENAYVIHKELGEWMTANMTVVRENKRLEATIGKIKELKERYGRINMSDTSRWNNQGVAFTRQLWNMLELAEAMTLGALLRNESRGAHYKPEFPNRNDEEFLKTTKATWTPDGPQISYEEVDVSLIPPRVRDYSKD
ncbi:MULTISPECIES: succinate dehydrogenase flavoprotein subunit [unclassified Paenibacillus]|uniref:succinate dehydrogenase flavoprotein subunit n=1 Tax=unclassified Paenibacillus TaxID=185978 RepID=UPI00240641A6|nr:MULTISPECIES: succinate dehydrogenase flavoprotein subunit [unclassified Paenibacillus]MDF9842715.1 succinate dehydrogenase / fumarate reductase flavoprotein subunit [Paenibacillus sp. PastF-2]MDF9849417.1 succinate dehydrogenase / fumarate reductase flavoprotein subunit [Paenibacillus sp. PastM-2]MDF9855875.1 succinate dehydrogenase / fumarate reductase flavoprotein subunit [Paenibacillus sp. PastF-1]MDH6481259.1 succinate dehydrogenase / fumarate reductase flavoprotein subunit [Paenibacill